MTMDQQQLEQPRSYSPPPGWHQIHGLPNPQHLAQTTSDLDVYAPPKMRIQIKHAIAADATVTMKSKPHVRLSPNDGPVGFGYYKQSDEDPSIINYYPVSGVAEHLLAQREVPRDGSRYGRHSMAPPPKVPSLPPRAPTFNHGYLSGTPGGDPWMELQECEQEAREQEHSGKLLSAPRGDAVYPGYLGGEQETDPWLAQDWKQPIPTGLTGMDKATHAEMMKPVVPWDECTAWRKDPSYKARMREEERKKDEEEYKKWLAEDDFAFGAFRRGMRR